MAYIIKDECGRYIMKEIDGGFKRTSERNLALEFDNLDEAIAMCRMHKRKLSECYVYDTYTKRICYITKNVRHYDERQRNGRKMWDIESRLYIYNKSEGCCTLCGKKLLFKQMSLDHVKPLSMGGSDTIDNLSATCKACNQMKSNSLPEEFEERISDIFMYQMEKKHSKKLGWKIAHKLLVGMM